VTRRRYGTHANRDRVPQSERLDVDGNPYEPPKYPSGQDRSPEASLPHGEEILVQIAARSFAGRYLPLRFRWPMIGKLVLTNHRVFFLSSGKTDGFDFLFEQSMVERIAKPLDITALRKKRSWEFKITELQSVEAVKESWSRGAHLRVIGPDRHGRAVMQQVYRYGIKWDTWEGVAARINEIRQDDSRTARPG